MTEQELRNKIAKHVCCACEMGLGDGECAEVSDYRKCGVCGDVANALITAGIGDVKDLQAQVDALEITNIALQAGYDDAEKDRLYWVNKYKEAEHRAEVAEMALDKATELAYTYRTQDDTLSCSSCPFDSIFDRCKERGLYEDCSKRWKEELLQQAEKELHEERKDE